mmetsp:Transcript_75042/g.195509  ORF Transcript_75042/g.195509 Transcript_75042/m.195509 type:complete len:268 (-) Transcript_75042:324-1127(-)
MMRPAGKSLSGAEPTSCRIVRYFSAREALSPACAASSTLAASKLESRPREAGSASDTSASLRSKQDAKLRQGTQSSPTTRLVVCSACASARLASSTCGHARAKQRTSVADKRPPPSCHNAVRRAATPPPKEWPTTSTRREPSGSRLRASSTTTARGSDSLVAACSMPPWAKPCCEPRVTGSGLQSKSSNASRRQDEPLSATTTQPFSWSTATSWPGTCGSPSSGTRPSAKKSTSMPSGSIPAHASACLPRPPIDWHSRSASRKASLP